MASVAPEITVITPTESWQCDTLPERLIEQEERNTSLGRLYRLWRNVRGDDIPTECRFDPEFVLGKEPQEGFLRISTESPSPTKDAVITTLRESLEQHQMRVSGLVESILHRETVIEFYYCWSLRIPVYQDINHVISMAEFPHRRLLLPVKNDMGAVSGIFLCYRMLDSAEH